MKTLDIGLLFANKIIKESIGEIAYATDNPEVGIIEDSTYPLPPLQDAYYMPSGEKKAYKIDGKKETCSFQLVSDKKVKFYSNQVIKTIGSDRTVISVCPTGIYNGGKQLEYAYVSNSKEKGTIIKKIKSDGRQIFVSSGALSGCTACNMCIPELNIGYFFHVGGSRVTNYSASNKNRDLFNAILYALTLEYSETNQRLLSEQDAERLSIDQELDVSKLWGNFNKLWNERFGNLSYIVNHYYMDSNDKISNRKIFPFQNGAVYSYRYSNRGMLLCTYELKTCNNYYMLLQNQTGSVGNKYLYYHLQDQHLEVRWSDKCNIV